jgi:DNA polymerase-3 subunit alpha
MMGEGHNHTKPSDQARHTGFIDAGSVSHEATVDNLIRPDVEMTYVSLHHHTTYSYQDGYGLPSQHAFRAAELGMSHLTATEHGNVSSHVKLAKACEEFDLTPIFGCELYCGKVDEEERTQRKNHLTVIAKDQPGYQNLLRVVSQGWDDYYYEPTVSGGVLNEYKEGLIILSGCTGSLLATSAIGGKLVDPKDASYARALETAKKFKRTFGSNYFLEVQMFPELPNVCALNAMYERISRATGIPLVATGDVHYTKPSESELQMILHSIGRNQSLEDLARGWGYDVPLSPPESDQEVLDKLRRSGLSKRGASEALANTRLIAEACNVKLPTMERVRFPMPHDGCSTATDLYRKWLRDGWRFRGFDRLPPAEAQRYRERLALEMSICDERDFVDYFLVVSHLVKYAKDVADCPVGPARGSAAAALSCYLLRITEVNPMNFPNMMLERFIDPNREDLPDIDLDFDDEHRHLIFEEAGRFFGPEFVGKIGTFTKFKSRNSLDDVAIVHRIPKGQVEKVKEVLLERSSGDLRSSATIEDTVEQFAVAREVFEKYPDLWKATALEGNVKGMGIHAAGLVVSTVPLTDVCAVYRRIDKKTGLPALDDYGMPTEVVSMDKYDAEESGLLKIDILGLSTMGMIRLALSWIGMKLQDLYDLPLDDPETIQGFRENDCVGIFQFDGWAMRSVNRQLKPDNFEEIAAVNALARPGPLHSGASADYVDAKFSGKGTSIHPILDPITASTQGQIIYQEQILRIVREIGDFSWTHASYIRKIISRKIGEQEFNRQKQTFVEGARKKGLTDEVIDQIWGACITAGSYAFNVPHCVSYGMIGYWTMWLKRHHPVPFYAAALQKYNDEKTLLIMRDADRHGVKVLPPDLNKSVANFIPTDDGVLAGFEQIPGIGDKMSPKILEMREKLGGFKEWRDLEKVPGIGPKKRATIEEFAEADDPFGIHKLRRAIEEVKRAIRDGDLPKVRNKRGELIAIPYPTHNSDQIPDAKGSDVEIVWAGTIHQRNLRDLREINLNKSGEALDLATVDRPDLLEWCLMHGEDHLDQVSIATDRYSYPRLRRMIWDIKLDHDIVIIHGIKRGFMNRKDLKIWDMWVVDPE